MKKALKVLLVCFLILAATVVGSVLTLFFMSVSQSSIDTNPVRAKVDEIGACLDAYFIDDYDPDVVAQAAADGAAAAMVEATGDRWSYYISAEEMDAYNEGFYNEYVGVGITIQLAEQGLQILSVTEGGPAEEAGILVDDILTHIDGTSSLELGVEGAKKVVRGEAGTTVHLTLLRGEETLEMDVQRRQIITPVAEGQMMDGNIGWIKIYDFETHCAEQALACMEDLLDQGAEALLFDVRFNGGGLKTEMLKVLDALLPEGELFRSVDYAGEELIDYSDENCLDLPMAVLVNEDSYSAAEFFAAALQEYEKAVIVGQKTVGKGNFQYTIPLSDGSAVALSVGKYYTPKGKSLTDVGITPDMEVDLSEEDYISLYYGTLEAVEDEQLQAALSELLRKIS